MTKGRKRKATGRRKFMMDESPIDYVLDFYRKNFLKHNKKMEHSLSEMDTDFFDYFFKLTPGEKFLLSEIFKRKENISDTNDWRNFRDDIKIDYNLKKKYDNIVGPPGQGLSTEVLELSINDDLKRLKKRGIIIVGKRGKKAYNLGNEIVYDKDFLDGLEKYVSHY